MDVAIALGRGIGAAVACGLIAALPLIAGVLSLRVRLALGAVLGAIAGFLLVQDTVAWVGIAAGAIVGAGTAWAADLILAPAAKRGGAGGVSAIALVAAIALAALSLIPFVGYLLAVLVGAGGVRARRRSARTYAGLRVLK